MVYKRGKVWWFKFTWNGEQFRESTKHANKRVAEQIEAARKTALAKGDVGIRDRAPVPTFEKFAKADFLPHVESRFADKPGTLAYYRIQVGHLLAFDQIASARLDAVSAEAVTGFIEKRRQAEYEVATINRALQVLRRILRLAVEWGRIDKTPTRIALLPGEKRRERVLSHQEESKYLKAAAEIGEASITAYERALQGIRAVQRGQQPTRPADPFLLRDVATVLLDCGLRPDECYRLRWEQYREGSLHIERGKTANARRTVPLSDRGAAILEMRRPATGGGWIFPAPTQSGHVELSSLKKQHAKACKLAKLEHVPLYTFRHTCLTRWAGHMDPYSLAYFAGHSSFVTTRRYVHPNLTTAREAMDRARMAQSGHKIGHTAAETNSGAEKNIPVI
jgi:integrase